MIKGSNINSTINERKYVLNKTVEGFIFFNTFENVKLKFYTGNCLTDYQLSLEDIALKVPIKLEMVSWNCLKFFIRGQCQQSRQADHKKKLPSLKYKPNDDPIVGQTSLSVPKISRQRKIALAV